MLMGMRVYSGSQTQQDIGYMTCLLSHFTQPVKLIKVINHNAPDMMLES